MRGAGGAKMSEAGRGMAWMGGEIIPIEDARVPVTDWGVTHSDTTYDVAPVWDGAFFRLDDYLDRFEASCAALRLDHGVDRATLRLALHDMVAASGLRAAYVAMVAMRGVPLIPGTRDPRDCANHVYAWCVPYVYVFAPEISARGARLWVGKTKRRIPDTSLDQRVKNYHWGDFTACLFEAKDAGYDSTVLLDHDGNLTEGPGFNLFAVFGDRIVTPDRHCLHGITRRTALEIAGARGLAVDERTLPLDEALEADEIFVTTTGGGPMPVTALDERVFSNGAPGPVTTAIRDDYWTWMARPDFRSPVAYP